MVKSKKKTFINRKNAVTFRLVPRSQHDPLIVDEKAPQHVLVEVNNKPNEVKKNTDPVSKKEELSKYGVFFDDEYDYLQHLKERGNDEVDWEYVEPANQTKTSKTKPKLQLPSSVFQSEFEEKVGVLNKKELNPGLRLDYDPDIVATWDDDFNFDDPDNELEDDFVAKAMEGDNDEEDEKNSLKDHDYEGSYNSSFDLDEDFEDMDKLGPLERELCAEETKSRFTEYSMSSSVMRRNEQLTLLDDRFEEFFKTYDDQELGPLEDVDDFEQIGQKHPLIKQCIKDFKSSKDVLSYNKDWDKDRIRTFEDFKTNDDELIEIEVKGDLGKKWDCESILSTYSNIYNHPTLIEEPKSKRSSKIKIDPKTGIPMDVLKCADESKLTSKALAKFDNENILNLQKEKDGDKSFCAKSIVSAITALSIRPADETPEEKKERKKLVKEYRSERRLEKKANSLAFKEEQKLQRKNKINNLNNSHKKIV